MSYCKAYAKIEEAPGNWTIIECTAHSEYSHAGEYEDFEGVHRVRWTI